MTEQSPVVTRDTIPPIHEVEEGGEIHGLGELRDFRWNDQLREFMRLRRGALHQLGAARGRRDLSLRTATRLNR